jgi:cytochrome P450
MWALTLGGLPPTDLFTGIARQYPRIAHTRLGREHLYLVNHPETVRELFVQQGRATMKGRALQRSKQLLGEGLLTSEGELWRRQRRLVQPSFHHDRVGGYVDRMVRLTNEHVSCRWQDGLDLDLAVDMAALALTIVGSTLFGSDLRTSTAEVGAALTEMVGQFRRRVLPGSELLDRIPLPSNVRALEAQARLDVVVAGLVSEQRDRQDRRTAGAGGGVLAALLATDMPSQQVRDEVMTLLLAGHETTANTLTWAWFLLSRDDGAADRLRAEVAEVVGDRDVTADDLARLPWTTAVVAETLRLYPPAWSLGRRLLVDAVVDGWTLPAGSLAVASQWVLHRDPRCWPEADTFRPERWLDGAGRFDESAPGQPRGSWFPFGLGQRVCVGEPFAWTEAVAVLATLAPGWTVTVPAGHVPRVRPAVTLRPLGGMPARVSAR